MPVVADMKSSLKKAMFDKNDVEKNILRVVLGEVNQLQMSKQQGNKPVADEQVYKIVRKIMQSNNEVIEKLPDDNRKAVLFQENTILDGFLPHQLSPDEIKIELLKLNLDNSKKSIGVAMKYFKENEMFVDGNDVRIAIESLGG
ncbi:MAG: hypothetical protein DWQ19_09905 [Crenarchaeota archaeon]|nr:MAG: hypothetical protein DWQ19_09905 [Thermoproteota archaeon]